MAGGRTSVVPSHSPPIHVADCPDVVLGRIDLVNEHARGGRQGAGTYPTSSSKAASRLSVSYSSLNGLGQTGTGGAIQQANRVVPTGEGGIERKSAVWRTEPDQAASWRARASRIG